MAYIKFNDRELPIEGTVIIVSENLIRIINEDGPDVSGFSLFIDEDMKLPMSEVQYGDYTTLYNSGEGWYELSNDGSVYVEPIPVIRFIVNSTAGTIEGEIEQSVRNYEDLVIPTVTPSENYEFIGWYPEIPETGEITKDTIFNAGMKYIPTIEEVKYVKITEVSAAHDMIVQNGVDVTLSNGTVEHFALTNKDQTYLMGLQTQVIAGAEQIPWHPADVMEQCKYYSNADMALITATALQFVTYHVTYLRGLMIYINAIEDKEALETIIYGTPIPEEYQSEPLKDMMVAMTNVQDNETVYLISGRRFCLPVN